MTFKKCWRLFTYLRRNHRISFKTVDDKLLFNYVAYDSSDNRVIEICDNEITHSTIAWDAEWKSNKLTLREGNGRYLLRLIFKTPNIIEISKGYIHHGITDIILDEDILFIANIKRPYSFNTAKNCRIGIGIRGMPPYRESPKEIKKLMMKAKKTVKTALAKADKA